MDLSTPPPLYLPGPGPACPPSPMPATERAEFRTTAVRALKLYPGPLGELVARELRAHDDFGWRFSNDALLTRVRDKIDEEWLKRSAV